MPKHLFRRILPTPEKVARVPGIKYFGDHIMAPKLWYVNRRSIAGAVFWGLFCGMLPIPMHTFLAVLAAVIFGVNLPICLLMVWVSNPITLPPILGFGYWIGAHLLHEPMISAHQIGHLFKQFLNWIIGTGKNPFDNNMHISIWPLIVGLMVEALLLSSIAALLTRIIWRFYVIFKWRQRKKRPLKNIKAA